MNQYLVDKKKFIQTCEEALKNLDKEILESSEQRHFAAVNDAKDRKKIVLKALKFINMPFVKEAYMSTDFLDTLNYCLTYVEQQ